MPVMSTLNAPVRRACIPPMPLKISVAMALGSM